MRSIQLLNKLTPSDTHPEADPIYVDRHGRILRFDLEAGQSIKPHSSPDSPFYAVILKGEGMFAGADGKEERFGPNSLLIFEPGEEHSVRALDNNLVFVGFLHGAPSNVSDRVGGILGNESK